MTDSQGPDTDALPSDDAETPPETGKRKRARQSPQKSAKTLARKPRTKAVKKPRKRSPSSQKRATAAKKTTPKRSTRKSKTAKTNSVAGIDVPDSEQPISAPEVSIASALFNFTLLGEAEMLPEAERPTTKRGRGRPKLEPTKEMIGYVERLAALGLGQDDTAFALGVHRQTFAKYRESHFIDAIKSGKSRARVTSGAVLMREMLAGNMTALIWFEKTRLGMTEKVHTVVSNPDGGPVESNVHHSGAVAIGLYLPSNGRDVPVEGQHLPHRNPLGLPANAREVAVVDDDAIEDPDGT